MTLTSSRTLQYIIIIIILAIIGGGIYKYFQARAAKIGVSQNTNKNGLVAHWTFDGVDTNWTNATTGTTNDISGNGNTGTLTGMTMAIAPVPGKIGQALRMAYQGGDKYVQGPTMNLNSAGSVSVWFKGLGLSTTNSTIISTADWDTGLNGFIFTARTNVGLYWSFGNASSTQSTNGTNIGTIANDIWYHAVLTWNGSTVVTYLDGVQMDSRAQTVSLITTVYPLRIGENAAGGNRNFLGIIDDVQVYNRVLSANEVVELYKGDRASMNTGAIEPQSIGQLNTGLVGYWKLDDVSGTNASDSSTNANNGTLSGSTLPTWTTGRINSGLNFTNSLNHVHVPHSSSINLSRNITFAAWVNVSSYGTQIWAGKSTTCYNSSQVGWDILATSAPTLNLRLCGSGVNFSKLFTPPVIGTWTHIAFTYDGSNVITYTNGVPSAPAAFTGDLTAASNHFAFGAADGGAFPLDGSMDEVRLYDRALSANEITKLYALTTPTGVDTSLKGYWSFDGNTTKWTSPTAGTVMDLSGAGNIGTITNMALATASVPGKLGQALNFDGVDDYINIPDSNVFTPALITFSGWYKTRTPSVSQPLYNQIQGGDGITRVDIFVGPGIYCTFSNGAAYNPGIYTVPTSSRDSNWHHVVCSWDGTNVRTYFDGVLVLTEAFAGSLPNISAPVQIGRRTVQWFNGSIDDIRLYNRILSADEVAGLYKMGGANVNTSALQPQGIGNLNSGLTEYWKFDEGSGTTTTNSSTKGSASDGTLTGSTLPTWGTGKIGGGLDFSGVTNSNVVGPSSYTGFNNDYTVSLWFKSTEDNTNAKYLVTTYNGFGGTSMKLIFKKSGVNQIVTFGPTGGSTPELIDATIVNGAWHHIVATRTIGGVETIYDNGVQMVQNTSGTTGTLTMGAGNTTLRIGGYASSAMTGSIDEVRIYNRALSADEVAKLYQLTTPTGVDTSLKGYWSFDGKDVNWTSSSAGTVTDLSGNNNNGTLTNMALATAPVAGKIGQALNFDGTNYVSVPYAGTDFELTDSFSFSMWAKWDTNEPANGWKNFLGRSLGHFNVAGTHFYVCTNSHTWCNANSIGFSLEVSGSAFGLSTAVNTVTPNVWTYVTVTYNGNAACGGVKLYVNGVNLSATCFVGAPGIAGSIKPGINWRIGDDAASGFFSGSMDEVRIYNRVLSADEVASLYNTGR